MTEKRILTVQDLSCLGRCSAVVALPVLAAWGHETCFLPTALLSTHTAFREPYLLRLSDSIPEIVRHWQRENIVFDAILVGYLGSEAAIAQVIELVELLLAPGGVCVVDPVMADHGRLYRGFDQAYVSAMGELCRHGDILLPNVTEAALLAGVPYPEELTQSSVRHILEKLPCDQVVLTGAVDQEDVTGIAVKQSERITFHRHPKAPGAFHGTGDLFAACLTGGLVSGKSLPEAAAFAADFTGKCAMKTAQKTPKAYGIAFESLLGLITKESEERI